MYLIHHRLKSKRHLRYFGGSLKNIQLHLDEFHKEINNPFIIEDKIYLTGASTYIGLGGPLKKQIQSISLQDYHLVSVPSIWIEEEKPAGWRQKLHYGKKSTIQL